MAIQSYKSNNRKMLLGQDNNSLVFLFAVNMLMFVAVNFIKVVYYLSETPDALFYTQVLNWLSLPAQADTFLTRPWTFISAIITHHSVWQLISSMLWLWCFGFILQDLAGNNKLIPIYIYGGFVGSFSFLLMNNLVPVLANNVQTVAPLLGAGSAVMAIAVATTTLVPDYRIFTQLNGGIPLWVITLIFVAIDFATLASSNAGIGAGHLLAGLLGYFYIRQLRRGSDWGAWMNKFAHWLNDLFNPDKKHNQSLSSDKQYYKTGTKPFEEKAKPGQQKLDEILDKINEKGYQFLTDDEKKFLKRSENEDI